MDLLYKYPIRQELLEHVTERELSDLPIKTFKVVSYIDVTEATKITIRTKTHLGAAITFYDYSTINELFSGNPWRSIDDLVADYEDIFEKERIVVGETSNGGDDTYLVEVNEEDLIDLSLFPTNLKAARA